MTPFWDVVVACQRRWFADDMNKADAISDQRDGERLLRHLGRYRRIKAKEQELRSIREEWFLKLYESANQRSAEANALRSQCEQKASDKLRIMLRRGELQAYAVVGTDERPLSPTFWDEDDAQEVFRGGLLTLRGRRCRIIIKGGQAALEGRPPPDRGGRPRVYDWDAIWIEICKLIHDEGIPETQARLISKIQDRCSEKFGNFPSDSILKRKVGLLMRRLRT